MIEHTYSYEDGNRLPVPAEVNGPHFMYIADSPQLSARDIELVVPAVIALVAKNNLHPSEIQVVSPHELEGEAGQALNRLRSDYQASLKASNVPSLLVCEWAAPHVDDSYEGSSFASYVMHTGPYPYVMQTLHSYMDKGGFPRQEVRTNTRVVAKGQTFVFDPTTPHLAMPAHPHQGQLLILLQVELPDADAVARGNMLELLPPLSADQDNTAVFEGIF